MTNEEIVISRIDNKRFSNKPIHFCKVSRSEFIYEAQYIAYCKEFDDGIKSILEATTIEDRIYKILKFNKSTFHENGKYQCRAGARRSTIDIWRIYKYYFGDIDIFSIMRALHNLIETTDLNTYRCPDIKKRVFWFCDWMETKNYHVKAELGVPLSEWKTIGENYNG